MAAEGPTHDPAAYLATRYDDATVEKASAALKPLAQGEWTAQGRFQPDIGVTKAELLRFDRQRAALEVGASTTKGAGDGLFAKDALENGEVFPYWGVVFADRDDVPAGPLRRYMMAVGSTACVVADPMNLLCPVAFANEPPPGVEPNLIALTTGVLGHPSETPDDLFLWRPITPIVVATTRPVAAGEELWLHYGPLYDRSHYSGSPTKAVTLLKPRRVGRSN